MTETLRCGHEAHNIKGTMCSGAIIIGCGGGGRDAKLVWRQATAKAQTRLTLCMTVWSMMTRTSGLARIRSNLPIGETRCKVGGQLEADREM
jgi:hypothetical protein